MEVKRRFVDPENVSLSLNRVVYSIEVADLYKDSVDVLEQFRFLGNCPPTPPLSHHFSLSER